MANDGFTPQQIHTITQIYGHVPTQLELNQISGNGRLQQYLNQRAGQLGLHTPVFAPSARSAIAQDLLPLLGQLGGVFGPAGDAGAGAGETAGVSGSGAGAAAGTGAGAASNVFKVAKFAAAADFLSYIAWIFHPQTLLRIVEFIVGFVLAGWGVYILTSSSARRGGGASSIIRRSLSMTPAGRAMRVREGRRMGKREGQREAARMEARQAETRSQRESSAVERERINLNARKSARS